MKITLNTKALLGAVLNLIKVIPAKSPLPMLENFLVLADQGRGAVGITASDQETTMTTTLPAGEDTGCTIEESGTTALPARILLDILKQVENETITVETVGPAARISWKGGQGTIPTFDPADYPQVDLTVKDGTDIEIPGKELSCAIEATLYAAGDDQARPVMNGIFVHARKDGLHFVSSDAHRLAIHAVPGIMTEDEGGFILHKKNASIIKNLIAGDEDVRIRFSDKRATFGIGNITVSVRPITGKYPKYQDVIPKKNDKTLTVDAKLLASVIKRVQVCGSKTTNLIKITFVPDVMGVTAEITAEDLGFATAAFEKLGVEYAGDPISIAFKAPFLIELLGSFGEKSIKFSFSEHNRAALATEAEPDPEATSTDIAIIMPISST